MGNWVAAHGVWAVNLATAALVAANMVLYGEVVSLVTGAPRGLVSLAKLAMAAAFALQVAAATCAVACLRGRAGLSLQRMWPCFLWSSAVCAATLWLMMFVPVLLASKDPVRALASPWMWSALVGFFTVVWLAVLAGQASGWVAAVRITHRKVVRAEWPPQPWED